MVTAAAPTKRTAVSEVRAVPIPQADDLNKILEVVELVSANTLQRRRGESEILAEGLDVVQRQAMFYLNAAMALQMVELVEGEDGEADEYRLTKDGEKYMAAKDKNRVVRRIVLESPVITWVAEHMGYKAGGLWPIPDDMLDVVKVARVLTKLGLSGVTPLRRAYTVRAWLKALEEGIDVD